MSARLLTLHGATVAYGGRVVLRGVDLAVDAGEIVTLVGPNGSGKSTLLRAIGGVVPLCGGRIVRAPWLRLGYVPQKLSITDTMPMTVSRFMGLARNASRAERDAAIERVGIAALREEPVTSLSGGQLQRVLLAHAIAGKPQLLLLDEPTQGLDPPGRMPFIASSPPFAMSLRAPC